MTDPEVRRLLAAVMAYDNRKPGEATVAAWTEAAGRARWTYPEALDAVHAHYATQTTWLMPGHITQAIRAARQDQAMREQAPRPDELGQRRIEKLTSGAFGDIADVDGEVLDGELVAERHEAPRPSRYARPCSYCEAPVGSPCTRPSKAGPVVLAQVHPSRLTAAS